jgi:hypothetical protein
MGTIANPRYQGKSLLSLSETVPLLKGVGVLNGCKSAPSSYKSCLSGTDSEYHNYTGFGADGGGTGNGFKKC